MPVVSPDAGSMSSKYIRRLDPVTLHIVKCKARRIWCDIIRRDEKTAIEEGLKKAAGGQLARP